MPFRRSSYDEAMARADGRVLPAIPPGTYTRGMSRCGARPRFDDDVVAMFAQMVGAPAKRTGTAADFAALVGEIRKQVVGAIGQVVT